MVTLSVVSILQQAAAEAPDSRAFTLLVDGETQEVTLTYAQVDRQARQVAAALQRLGLRGERVVLAFPFGLEFTIAVVGCMYAGAVAVLAQPPRPEGLLASMENVVRDSQSAAALTTEAILGMLKNVLPAYPALNQLQWLAVEALVKEQDPLDWRVPPLMPDTPAFLSYTSGSTSNPRGVLLTFGNLLACLDPLKSQFQFSPGGTGVFCSPMHHISSIISGIAAMTSKMHNILVPTQLVLERPFRWLRAVSTYRARISGGFNFLFQLSTQGVSLAERDTMDLSCLEVLSIGGERVDGPLLERFIRYFEPVGFDRKAIRVGYSLTESTTVGTASKGFRHQVYSQRSLFHNQAVPVSEGAYAAVDLVSCGNPLMGRCIVVDPETHLPCADQRIGEVWIHGAHVAAGYWQQPELTAETFHAYLKGSGEGPFLRTGDLGFYEEGELVISGRIKDVIILRGQNYFAPDFEQAVSGAHPAIVLGGTAALGLLVKGEERLAIVQEVLPGTAEEDYDGIVRSVRSSISTAFEQPVYAVVLVEQGKLPRTMSRKIQRYRCLQAYQEGQLSPLKIAVLPEDPARVPQDQPENPAAPRTPVEAALLGIWLGVLKAEGPVGMDDNFFAVGGNSLHAAQVVSQVRDIFRVELPLQVFFDSPTIAGMASFIDKARGKPGQ